MGKLPAAPSIFSYTFFNFSNEVISWADLWLSAQLFLTELPDLLHEIRPNLFWKSQWNSTYLCNGVEVRGCLLQFITKSWLKEPIWCHVNAYLMGCILWKVISRAKCRNSICLQESENDVKRGLYLFVDEHLVFRCFHHIQTRNVPLSIVELRILTTTKIILCPMGFWYSIPCHYCAWGMSFNRICT